MRAAGLPYLLPRAGSGRLTIVIGGAGGLVLVVIVFVAMNADKVEKWVGWALSLLHFFDRAAVARSVQGQINEACGTLTQHAPENVIQGRLKLKFKKPEDAATHARGGEVVVFMKKARFREENVANAVMAFIPKAVIPRARRYVDSETMRAVDLTLARGILQEANMPSGALDIFLDKHLDPALAAQSDLRDHLEEVDQIDLHGWLTRVMLAEYKRLGDRLYPGTCDEECLQDAKEFRNWLGKLATQRPVPPGGTFKTSLLYRGRFLSAAVVFVAVKGKIEEHGIEPYRKRTKRIVYEQRADVVYLMARDDNIKYVKQLRDSLRTDGLIAEVATFEFRLRADFKARVVNRERAVIVMLRRKHLRDAPPAGDLDETDELREELGELDVYEPGALVPAATEEGVGLGSTDVGADGEEPIASA